MAVFGAGATDLAAAVPSIHLPAATPGRGRRPASSPDQVGEWPPVNLTPIAALERHLHRLQGDARLALRAVRETVLERNREGTDGMIDDEGRIGLVASVGSGRVDQPRGGSRRPRVEPRRRDRREPFEHDSRTASGAAGRPAGGSPGVCPRTRRSCSSIPAARSAPMASATPTAALLRQHLDASLRRPSARRHDLTNRRTRRCALPVAAAGRKRRIPLSRDGMSLMYLVQEHANRGCHLHGKPCVMGIEPYVPRRASMPCAERIAQLCKAPPERRDIIN